MSAGTSERPPLRYAQRHFPRFLSELREFVRIPSVSAQPQHAADVRKCAEWVRNHLQRMGVPFVRIVQTPRHPIVYGESQQSSRSPTLLVYGHYDVQPAGPRAQWTTAPFDPVVRNDTLFGRGSSDDKGQLFCHVKACESFLKSGGRLPVNLKFLFEGEEEIGSPNLGSFLTKHRRRLAADAAVISDTSIPATDRPAITYGLRGGLAVELRVSGPDRDLHSGHFGGVIHNPAQVLAEIIARMHRPDGRIAIPGVYDEVESLSQGERRQLRQSAQSDREILANARVRAGWGEQGYSLSERASIRPALTINGLSGGYAGPGNQSIIPSSALAKISFRLVPRQNPDRIERQLRQWLATVTPPTVSTKLIRISGSSPVVVNRSLPVFQAARRAYAVGFGADPVFVRSGGSIPVVSMFKEQLGIPTLLMGFGLPTDRVHGPNEHFRLEHLRRGIRTSIELFQAVSQLAGQLTRPRGVSKSSR